MKAKKTERMKKMKTKLFASKKTKTKLASYGKEDLITLVAACSKGEILDGFEYYYDGQQQDVSVIAEGESWKSIISFYEIAY